LIERLRVFALECDYSATHHFIQELSLTTREDAEAIVTSKLEDIVRLLSTTLEQLQ